MRRTLGPDIRPCKPALGWSVGSATLRRVDKGMTHLPGGTQLDAERFHHPLRTVCNAILAIVCLWEFPLNTFRQQLTAGREGQGKGARGKGVLHFRL